jgi:hypothetical protein
MNLVAALPAAASIITVHPGESIRAALAEARPGDRVQVLPGTYHEGSPGDLNALTIGTNGISLVGMSRPHQPVILENAGGQAFGIWVSPADSSGMAAQSDREHPPCGLLGTTVRAFAVRLHGARLRPDGVHLACVDGFRCRENVADANGANTGCSRSSRATVR